MKKIPLLTACFGFLAMSHAADAPFKAHPDSASWPSFYNQDLSNADFPKGVWFLTNGVLTATEDQAIWTREDYENFAIDLEFKTDSGANSGVVVYASDTENWIPNSVEIQILDDHAEKWSKVPQTWTCGGVFGRLAPSKHTVKKPGEWNRMTVTCKGPNIWVLLNGEQVAEMDMKQWTSAAKNPDGSEIPSWLSKPLAQLATKGRVGLQGKHSGAAIYFRNVKIKRLE